MVEFPQPKQRTQQGADAQQVFTEWLVDRETSLGPCRDGSVGEIMQAGHASCRLRGFYFNSAVSLSLNVASLAESGCRENAGSPRREENVGC